LLSPYFGHDAFYESCSVTRGGGSWKLTLQNQTAYKFKANL